MSAKAIVIQEDGTETPVTNQFGTVSRKIQDGKAKGEFVMLDHADSPGRVSVDTSRVTRILEIKSASNGDGSTDEPDVEIVDEEMPA